MRPIPLDNNNSEVYNTEEDGEQHCRMEDRSERTHDKKNRVAFIFYDFETRQDQTLQGTANVKIHVPTLCVAQQICEACADINETSVRCQ